MNSPVLRRFLVLLILVPAVHAAADPVEIVRRSLAKDRLNSSRAKDYTFVQRVEKKELDSQDKVTKLESSTFDITMIGERPYRRKIAFNDKPLPEKEVREAQDKFDREIRKREQENAEDRRRRLAEEEKERQEGRAFLDEIPQAFLFTLVGEGKVDDLPVWIIDAVPKPGYRGKAHRWELLTKFKGRLWIDQAEYQWVRVESETIAPVSFGWILAKLDPGARLNFQQQRVNSEVWLPVRATTKLSARLALFKKMRGEFDITWKDYRKFSTDSRVVSAEEVNRQPAKR